MTWQWYPGAWNDFADRSLNSAVGCSKIGEHPWCWARRFARRRKVTPCNSCCWKDREQPCKHYYRKSCPICHGTGKLRGCWQCYEFRVHDHFERWQTFRAKPGERIAFCYMGDLFDPVRPDHAIARHLNAAIQHENCTWLIQTRHVWRLIDLIRQIENRVYPLHWTDLPSRWGRFEIGTTFSGSKDIENVCALKHLPDLVRFIAFEPFNSAYFMTPGKISAKHYRIREDALAAIENAKPHWFYIGPKTPKRKMEPNEQKRLHTFAVCVSEICDSKVIYKASCGPELYKLNKGVTLP